MIPLLEKLQVWRGNAAELLDERCAQLLEWRAVTAQVAVFCRNDRAAAALRDRLPRVSLPYVEHLHLLQDEMRRLDTVDHRVPLANVTEAWDLLHRSSTLRLEGPDLVRIAALAEDLDIFRDSLIQFRQQCPIWGEAAIATCSHTGVSGAIRRALDPDGRITDGASAKLGRLRRQAGEAERTVRQEVNAAMAQAHSAGWTTGGEVTLRGDRYCIPLRSGERTRLPGIVHDRSATGATLFVEPAHVVSRANALVEIRLEVAAEEARILLELNRAVEQAAPSLTDGVELMFLADEVRAAVLWSQAIGGCRPRLAFEGDLRINGGRHPLLIAALGTETLGEGVANTPAQLAHGRSRVVALDLAMPADHRALVISGPNAGGKSVALKTVGVFCALAWCGWDIPAGEDTVLPHIGRVLADLGDDQSISEALSSFSAHLGHLRRFLEVADETTLVLCDEIGTGTDPQEGTALAFAVLEALVAKGARVLASTHYGLLKAAVHDHPRMLNAAMDYNERDLRPLFTLRVGDPGTSHAFDIASRMGFPPALLDRARRMAGTERIQVEKLLVDLDRRARELAETRQVLEIEKNRHAGLNLELEKRLKGVRKEQREILAHTRRDQERLAREGRRAIENAVRDIKSSGAEKVVVKQARARVAGLVPDEVKEPSGTDATARVTVGQRVRIPRLNLIGTVVEVRGGKVVALADNLRLSLDRQGIVPLDNGPVSPGSILEDRGTVPISSGGWSWQGEASAVPPEIDLRGQQGEEAWQALDRLIDRAIPAGLEVLNVIHGFGTGRLRDYLYDKLKQDSRVASMAEAGPGRGGGGATLVYLVNT